MISRDSQNDTMKAMKNKIVIIKHFMSLCVRFMRDEKNLTFFTFLLAIGTFGIVLFNGILTYTSYKAWKDSSAQIDAIVKMTNATQDMAKATKEMSLATQKSIAIAESSNLVAKRGVNIEQENMYSSNTPYISISIPSATMKIEKGGQITGIVRYFNIGKTPALDFRSLPIVRMKGKYAPADSE
jgi:hypothetical protein